MSQSVWIASMVLQWLVIAILCLLILSIVRQLGALHLRLNALRDASDERSPALYTRLPPHELTLVDGTTRIVIGGGGGGGAAGGGHEKKPSLIVFFSPSCGACEALPGAIATLGRDLNGSLDLLAVISGDRADAGRFAAERSLTHVPVAASQDFPEHYIPRAGVPFGVALSGDGKIAARGKPKSLEHLREMVHAARHMAELATTHSLREHEWGESAPYWEG